MFEPHFATDLTLKRKEPLFLSSPNTRVAKRRRVSQQSPAKPSTPSSGTSLSTESRQPLESTSSLNRQSDITFESSSGEDQSSRPKVSGTLPPLPSILAKTVLEENFVDVPAEGEQLLFLKDFFQSSLTEEDIHFFWVENLIVLNQISVFLSLKYR